MSVDHCLSKSASTTRLTKFLPIIVLFLSSPTVVPYVASVTVHIVTSPDQFCPGQFTGYVCVTLQQFIRGDHISDPNAPPQNQTILDLQPGVHVLSSDISLSNVDSFEMRGENAEVRCSSRDGNQIRFFRVRHVVFSGVNFTSCSQLSFSLVTNATIVDVSFYDMKRTSLDFSTSTATVKTTTFTNGGTGSSCGSGAIEGRRSTITMEGCTFRNNTAFCRVNINRPGFFVSRGKGGAISTTDTDMEITDCTFYNDTAVEEGGAVYAQGSSQIQIHSSTFSSHSAERGAAVFLDEVSTDGSVILNQSSFIDNAASLNNGGGLYISGRNVRFSIYQSRFVGNRARVDGGAVYFDAINSLITVHQSDFNGNIAGLFRGGGGAIHAAGQNVTYEFTENNFTNNLAPSCAVFETEDIIQRVFITRNTFTNNRVVIFSAIVTGFKASSGGVACINGAFVSITNSSFLDNSALGHAGVLSVEDSMISIFGSDFHNNYVNFNGGVVSSRVTPITLSISESSFTNNMADGDGGVIHAGRDGSLVDIQNSVFSFNNASQRGGVVSIVGSNSELNITDSILYSNVAMLGDVASACSSQVSLPEELTLVEDPASNFLCTLYDGNVCSTCATTTTEPTTATTVPLTTTASTTSQPPPDIRSTTLSSTTEADITTNPPTESSTQTLAPTDARTTMSVTNPLATTTTSPVTTDMMSTTAVDETEQTTTSPPTTNPPLDATTTMNDAQTEETDPPRSATDRQTTEPEGTSSITTTVPLPPETSTVKDISTDGGGNLGNQGGEPAVRGSDVNPEVIYAALLISIITCVLVVVLYVIVVVYFLWSRSNKNKYHVHKQTNDIHISELRHVQS